jgi:hypothetical protein
VLSGAVDVTAGAVDDGVVDSTGASVVAAGCVVAGVVVSLTVVGAADAVVSAVAAGSVADGPASSSSPLQAAVATIDAVTIITMGSRRVFIAATLSTAYAGQMATRGATFVKERSAPRTLREINVALS